MRVLRLIARLNVGGPARQVVWLTDALAKEGHEVLLVTGTVPPGEQDMSGFATAHGVTPLVLPSMSRELSPRDLVTIWQVWRLMRRFKPDVVHTHTAKAGAVGRIAGWLYGRGKFVHTYHGHVFHSYYGKWKTRLFLAIERFLARVNTDRIIVLSEQQLHEIRDQFRVGKAEQFAVVPLGIDLDEVRGPVCSPSPAAAGEGAPERSEGANEGLTVGIAGRITAIKNHDLFLKVAARCHDLARFVVYGDGEDRAKLEERAPNVVFAGTKNAAEIYASLDVVALTSRNEGTPLVLIEAMACGKPVISTAVGGVVDLLGAIVEHHDGFDIRERGVTAASNDAVGFSEGLAHLLRDEALRRSLAERGRDYVESTHSKARLVADILGLYRDLLAS